MLTDLLKAKFPLAAAFLSDITKLTKVNDILVPRGPGTESEEF